jgi:VIT1/CCC1 family predicted Fe2+/Mn2+ transporter
VPFALAAGLTGAISQTDIIITAGLAEVAAGSIAMGLGGYLASRGDAEHYASEQAREELEIRTRPEDEVKEVLEVFSQYGLKTEESMAIVNSLSQRPKDWVAFMMRFELGLEEPDPSRAWKSAITIASAYIVGGLVPLSAYFVQPDAGIALKWSAGVTLAALAVFGAAKSKLTGAPVLRGAFQTTLIGGLAASAAFLIARWLG